jgi:nucleoside-diphosphate-sugar epimerase
MASSSKILLVTGSKGFIGRNIVEFFKNHYNVLAPTHHELDLLSQRDVNKYFKINKIHYVIHCANVGGNRTRDDGPGVVEENLRMFFNLAENQANFRKMIHLGSGAEYSREKMPAMVPEDDFGKFIPSDYYGFSKYIISKYIQNNPDIYCLRLFGVFGPGEDYRYKFISNSIMKNLLELPITIMQNVYFDWLYIQDLMHIIEHFLLNNPQDNTYNITSGKKIDLLSIAQIINDASNFKSPIKIVNKGLNREYSGDNHKLLAEIGNYDFLSMEKSIKDLINYYKSNFASLDLDTIREDPYASKCKINKEK